MKIVFADDIQVELDALAKERGAKPQEIIRAFVYEGLRRTATDPVGVLADPDGPRWTTRDPKGRERERGTIGGEGLAVAVASAVASASSPLLAPREEETNPGCTKPAQRESSERDQAEAAVAELERQLAAAREACAATVRAEVGPGASAPDPGVKPQKLQVETPGSNPAGAATEQGSTPQLDPPARPTEMQPAWPFPPGTKAKVSRYPKLEFGLGGEQGVVELPVVLGEPLRDLFCPHCHATERAARSCAKRMIKLGSWGPGDKPKAPPTAAGPRFRAFMAAWPPGPRKVPKTAEEAFLRAEGTGALPAINPDGSDPLLLAVAWWKLQHDWIRDGGTAICAPSVWLNQRRWEPALEALAKRPNNGTPIPGAEPLQALSKLERMRRLSATEPVVALKLHRELSDRIWAIQPPAVRDPIWDPFCKVDPKDFDALAAVAHRWAPDLIGESAADG